jgi:hypothetical protein
MHKAAFVIVAALSLSACASIAPVERQMLDATLIEAAPAAEAPFDDAEPSPPPAPVLTALSRRSFTPPSHRQPDLTPVLATALDRARGRRARWRLRRVRRYSARPHAGISSPSNTTITLVGTILADFHAQLMALVFDFVDRSSPTRIEWRRFREEEFFPRCCPRQANALLAIDVEHEAVADGAEFNPFGACGEERIDACALRQLRRGRFLGRAGGAGSEGECEDERAHQTLLPQPVSVRPSITTSTVEG